MNGDFRSIRELCITRTGYAFRQKPVPLPDGATLVIQPKDITSTGTITIHSACRASFRSQKRLLDGDVLLINRGRFTASVFHSTTNEPCMATSAFHILTPRNPSQLLPEFLSLYFNSINGQNLFKRLTMTTTIPFISLGHLESIEIPLPSFERQTALATFGELNKAYARLSSRKAELQKQIIDQQIAQATPVKTL